MSFRPEKIVNEILCICFVLTLPVRFQKSKKKNDKQQMFLLVNENDIEQSILQLIPLTSKGFSIIRMIESRVAASRWFCDLEWKSTANFEYFGLAS